MTSTTADPTEPGLRSRGTTVLLLVAVVALSLNLRPAAVSVGPVLDEVQRGLGMSGLTAGLLTTLPVVAFAVLGLGAPSLARLVGLHRVTLVSLLLAAAGMGGRVVVDGQVTFLLLSALALSGAAAANVLLPSLVKLHFPDRVGTLTAVYSTSLAVGLTAASVLTVPLADAAGGWRAGLGSWALLALVCALPWLGLVRSDPRPTGGRGRVGVLDVARTSLGWRMAVFFGLQSLQAYSVFGWFAQVYRDAGFDASRAGVLLGVITGLSIPLSVLVPRAASRRTDQRLLLAVIMAAYPIGYLGLVLAPQAGAWLWAVLVGVALSTFPLVLTLIGLRARTSEGTAALSGFTQSTGYLIASVGPVTVGVLHDVSGGWTLPLGVLLVLAVPQLLVGLSVARPEYVEDHLPR